MKNSIAHCTCIKHCSSLKMAAVCSQNI